jgi:hypothetical protein
VAIEDGIAGLLGAGWIIVRPFEQTVGTSEQRRDHPPCDRGEEGER